MINIVVGRDCIDAPDNRETVTVAGRCRFVKAPPQFTGVLDKGGRQLGHGQVKWERVLQATGTAITFNKTANLRTPFAREVADTEVQCLILAVVTSRNAFPCQEIMEAAKVGAEDFRATLPRDLIDGIDDGLQPGMVQTEDGIDGMVSSVGRTSLDGAMFTTTNREHRFH